MRIHLYSTFLYLKEALNTKNREGMWKIMQKGGFTNQFIRIVRQFHGGVMARVTDNGTAPEAFAVTNGAKQGCTPALPLFSLVFSVMLMDAYREEPPRSTVPTGPTDIFSTASTYRLQGVSPRLPSTVRSL
ncbi:hypothetical protein SprV_0100074200 [Sparganum proliferum]